MKDLLESSQLFEASSRLQSAATALRKIEKGESLDNRERKDLKWSGHFLEEVDWDADTGCDENVSGDLSVQATEVRPSFYAALYNREADFQRAGITGRDQRHEFFSMTYRLLTHGGRVSGKRSKKRSNIELAALFLDELSKALHLRLTDSDEVSTETELTPLFLR
jgi:hypothetical protein